jgi:hypothetical protein
MAAAAGMNAYEAVDELLMARYGVLLEDVLCDGCLVGRLGAALGQSARIMPRLIRSTNEEDGGLAQHYEGIFVIEEIWYRFACQLFVDRGGLRFLSSVDGFEAVEWQARLAVPA